MILTRKILAPTLVLLPILLVSLFVYFITLLHNVNHEAEERDLSFLSTSFKSESENRQKLVLSLALDTAGNTLVQDALADRNKRELTNISANNFSQLMSTTDIVIYNYYRSTGELFLSVNDAINQSDQRQNTTVSLVNTTQTPAAGLEVSGGNLSIVGVAPVFHNGTFVGMVEIGTELNESLLNQMKNRFGGEWRILLTKEHVTDVSATNASPDPNLVVFAETQGLEVFNDQQSYSQAQQGITQITHPSISGRDYAIQSTPIYGSSGELVGVLDIIYDHTHISAVENQRLVVASLVSIGILLIGTLGLTALTRRTLHPIQVLTRTAAEITDGKPASYINIETENDEIGILAQAFNRMTTQLKGSIVNLEERITDRTNELEEQSLRLRVATEISQFSLSENDLEKILDKSGQLLADRFGYYHVGIFLLDTENRYAVLSSAASKDGATLIEKKIQISMDQDNVIGFVARNGEARITPDTRFASTHFSDSYLPESKSQISLALKTGNKVIGVLDIHSTKSEAFKQADISVMQIVAGQLSTAIERVRLAQESQQTLSELAQAYGEYTQQGWRNLSSTSQIRHRGYRFNNIRIEPAEDIPEFGVEAVQHGKTVSTSAGHSEQEVAIPIKFRGQTIGVVHAKLREGAGDATISILEQAIDRLASSLESARLYEEAQVRANREQAISQIAGLIGSSSDYDTILRTTVREIGNVIRDSEVLIQIADNFEDR